MRNELPPKNWNEVKTNDSWAIFKIMGEFVNGYEKLSRIGPCVSIFGSARTKPGHEYYELAVDIANKMVDNFGDEIKVDVDILISGAILIDVGKLLEYEIIDGKLTTSNYGKVVRHPFSGVAIAARFDLPPEVQHIIGTHSKEGDLGNRTVESIIVHHADFVSFEPFKA